MYHLILPIDGFPLCYRQDETKPYMGTEDTKAVTCEDCLRIMRSFK